MGPRPYIPKKICVFTPQVFPQNNVTCINSGLIVTRTAWRTKVNRAQWPTLKDISLEKYHGIRNQHQRRIPELAA